MAFKFTDSSRYPYEPGGFFLGVDDQGREVGIRSDRHLITVAGARSGKGAALIVPNLKRWPGSCVVIDPKGENATITAGERKAMGQLVGVVDPYGKAQGDAAALRCSVNPLALLDPESLTIRADLESLADGLVRTFDLRHEEWAESARRMIAGAADYVMATQPAENWTLPNIRALFVLPPDDLKPLAEEMAKLETESGLAQEAGGLFLTKLANPDSLDAAAFGRAGKELGWIGDPAFRSVFGNDLPAFDLSTLKAGTGSLYLCIPPDKLRTRGQFLRLFVSMGLHVMASELAGHDRDKGECLFLLDEFHSLGRLDQVAVAAGQMPGYGVHLWPFLQDLGQLEGLYGANEMQTFFANADAHIFFGNTDAATLDYVSTRLGVWTQKEIGAVPPTQSGLNLDPDRRARAFDPIHAPRPMPTMPHQKLGGLFSVVGGISNAIRMSAHQESLNEQARERQAIDLEEKELAREDQNAMRAYQDRMAKKGEPLVTPQEVRELVAKRDGEAVARSMIVFAKGGDKLNIRLAPYFMPPPEKRDVQPDPLPDNVQTAGQIFAQYQAAAKAVSAPVSVWPRIVLAVVGYYVAYFVLLLVMPAQSGWIFAFMGALLAWEWQKRRDQQRLAILQKCEREMRKAMATLQTWMDENGPIPRTPATAAWVDSINAHARG